MGGPPGAGHVRERVLAIFGAVALIAAAFVVRSLIVGGDGGGSSESAGSRPSSGRPVVACTKDLMAMCDALAAEGAIAANPPPLELGSYGAKTAKVDDVDVDGWITWDPAPAMANFDAEGSEDVWKGDTVDLSTDQLAAIGPADILAGLERDCGDNWGCIAGSGLKIGVGQPKTAQGIARLSPLATNFAEEFDPATLDVAGLKALLSGPANGQESLTDQLAAITRPGILDLVVGPKAVLDRTAARPQGKARNLQVTMADSPDTISVVLATSTRSSRDLSGLISIVRSETLANVRDTVGMTAPPSDTGSAAPPAAGFLYQVREKVG